MDDAVRDIAGETVCGLRVAAYRETHAEHGDRYGHQYSEHWSTPSKNPAVKVERLFTEDQVRGILSRLSAAKARVGVLEEALDKAWRRIRDNGRDHFSLADADAMAILAQALTQEPTP